MSNAAQLTVVHMRRYRDASNVEELNSNQHVTSRRNPSIHTFRLPKFILFVVQFLAIVTKLTESLHCPSITTQQNIATSLPVHWHSPSQRYNYNVFHMNVQSTDRQDDNESDWFIEENTTIPVDLMDHDDSRRKISLNRRRVVAMPALILPTLIVGWNGNMIKSNANAAVSLFGLSSKPQSQSLYALSPQRNVTTIRTQQSLDTQLFPNGVTTITADPELTVELCLLRLLPVKNKFFRKLQGTLESLTPVLSNNFEGSTSSNADPWVVVTKSIQNNGISELDRKRSLLEPVFNPDEDTIMQISKAERFEILIESLRSRFIDIADATQQRNRTAALLQQKAALLLLAEIGELLVAKYPYQVPTEGRYSYLPRLLGRCAVTFTMRRKRTILGNITIIADGYIAPITAGNFVDLCIREFYTALPVKFMKKRLGSGSNFEVANLPILGSFNDGFYDPLTAKVRRLPIEIIRVGKGSGEPDLTYSQGLSTLNATLLQPTDNSRPLLSFKIPYLVAMNHPENNPNGASSEFFALQKDSVIEEKRSYLDGEYAPFGWIIDGFDLFQKLQANDIIDETMVSEFGKLNLVKLRRSSFQKSYKGAANH